MWAACIVTDNAGGKGTNTVTIWIGASNRPPVAVVSANPTKGNAPLTVNFSSAGSSAPDGSIASYVWNFGYSGNSTLANPAHTYVTRGSYVARLTVTDNLGATASKSVVITVRRPPQLTNARVNLPGTFTFNIERETNVTYILQSSTDCVTWSNVMTLPHCRLGSRLSAPCPLPEERVERAGPSSIQERRDSSAELRKSKQSKSDCVPSPSRCQRYPLSRWEKAGPSSVGPAKQGVRTKRW